MAAVALFMVGRLAKFNDIFTSTVPTINNFSNHALRINCLTLFVQLKIQNNILFLYTTREPLGNPVEEEWCGWRPMTYDSKPIISFSPKLKNVVIAAGHSKMGITQAPATGKLVSEIGSVLSRNGG